MATQGGNGTGGPGGFGPGDFARVESLVFNQVYSRLDYFRKLLDPRRDIDDECGYPSSRSGSVIDAEFYRRLYEREAVANRVVRVLPQESWQVTPWVYEDEDADAVTPFEEAWDALSSDLSPSGPASWFAQEEGSPVWDYLRRLDEMSGVGHYGVLLLGFDDGLDLAAPVAGMEEQYSVGTERDGDGNASGQAPTSLPGVYNLTLNRGRTKGRKLRFLRVFPEDLAYVTAWESNWTSPRFGQPTHYNLTFNDPRESYSGVGIPLATRRVHWTRVIHVADHPGQSEVYGTPRMRPVLNRLLDLRKLYSGSAEMYWRGAFPGVVAETVPQLGGDVQVDVPAFRDSMEQYMNGLQRYLLGRGLQFKTLAPTVSDPTNQINVQVEAICVQLGIPKRIFTGSERGELASSQDQSAWNDRLQQRQNGYLTPKVIVPFIDRLIAAGVLPEPTRAPDLAAGETRGFRVEWPDMDAQTEGERAAVVLQRTQALAAFSQGGCEAFITPFDFLVREMKYTEEDARAVLESAAEKVGGAPDDGTATGSPLLGLAGGVTAMIELFKLAKDGGMSEEQLKQQIMLFYRVTEGQAEALIADGLTPAAEEAGDPTPPEPPAPVKLKDGERLVDPSAAVGNYNPAQSRNPAGTPRGGEWSKGGTGAGGVIADPVERARRNAGGDPVRLSRALAAEYSYSGASAEDRQRLASELLAAGARQVGSAGEVTPFVARLHDAPAGMFPGDSARVVRPGFEEANGYLLVKAKVEPAAAVGED